MRSPMVVMYAEKQPMEGVVCPGPHQIYRNPRLEVEDRELDDPADDEIRVEMVYAGICGTDLHLVETDIITGYIRGSAPAEIPAEGRVIGHEGVGQIIAAGRNVRHVKEGDYVSFESILVCHYCDMCRMGHFNQCRQARLLGLERNGLFGSIVNVPSMLAHDLKGMASSVEGLRAAACIEPAGVAYVACQNTRITPGDTVAVFGAGPIGVLCAMLSKIVFGASVVYVIDPVQFRRNLAKKWCDEIFDVEDFFEEEDQKSIDVVIEASGYLNNIKRVFRCLNPGGRIALLARSGEPLTLDAVDHMITNAITLVGSRGHLGGAVDKIINLYNNGQIPIHDIITDIVKGPDGLLSALNHPENIVNNNCKVLAKFRI
jgi:threonine dehydrogenase-like Zn-dependent dehydrogenase